jgi:CubicO group peptidase (beta-lactamase class C family)
MKHTRLAWTILVALIIGGVGTGAASAKELPQFAPIITAPAADAVEKVAAQELAFYLKRLYPDYDFPVGDRRPPAGPEILVGTPAKWPELAGFVPQKELASGESFRITASGQTGVIAGADPRGVLFGVYALLERLGCGFWLSSESVPEPKGVLFDFSSWALEDRPLFADRIVFDWHNFLSSASTWELENWRQYIGQAAKMRFNTIMVHAYGNNPMFTFTHNGQTKSVGYAATTRSGRDWGTQHVNDVRRLVGGEVFDGPVFGSSIGLVPEDQRGTAAVDLMQKVFAYAHSRGLHVTFALDVDTESANPQNVIRTLPASARLKSGTFELVNPDTPEGFAYYKAQVRQLLETYPQIDRLAVWFRTGGTPWRNLKPEQFPPDWRREFDAALEKDPWLRKDADAHGMFAMGKLLRTFQRVLREMGRTDVELAAGSWRLYFLRAADHFFPREVSLIPLDWETVFDNEKGQQQLCQVRSGRRLIPIVWAHHDDRTYIGRPYKPFERFASQLQARGGTGFGIIHWTTRPLDLYFKSLSEQVWQATADRPLADTCKDFAAHAFGETARQVGGEYLLQWLSGAPMFGRETSNRFMDVPLTDVEGNMHRFAERSSLLGRIDEASLSPQGRERLAYYRDYERFMRGFYESHAALDRVAQLFKKGEREAARDALAQCHPQEVIRAYVQAAQRDRITRGEQALIVSLNLRWLPYVVSLRQALGLEPVRIKFLPTQHEPLAQGAGTNTFYVDPANQLWKGLGEKETGCPTFQLPTNADAEDFHETGLRIDKPVTLRLNAITGERLMPGRYWVTLLLAPSPADNTGSAEIELRGPRTEDGIARNTIDTLTSGTSGEPVSSSHSYQIQVADGQLELGIRPVRGVVFLSGVVVEAAQNPVTPRTRVAIRDGRWFLNDEVTYRGTKAEGLLMNVRMVNAAFEDLMRPAFDSEANTDEFIAQIPDYVAHGVRAFTVCLQGGSTGYEGALNSAFNLDGSLSYPYLQRVRRIVEACDRSGVVVILGCFYQRQDQVLKDEAAIRAGVVTVAKWVKDCGFTNVVLEIANEFGHSGFDHWLLKTPGGIAELIRLAKQTAPTLLVSASGLGSGRLAEAVARASDFLLIHFNSTPIEDVPACIAALKKFGKPIVCNEDTKEGATGAKAAEVCVANGASWGLMLVEINQHFPFTFRGSADDPEVYAAIQRLTSTGGVSLPGGSVKAEGLGNGRGRWRLLIETDAGGDPDDEQSLVRFLLYANEWDIEGIIANRPVTRRPENKNPEDSGLAIVRRLLDAYGQCRPNLVQHDPRYPTKEFLWQRTVAGYNGTNDAVNLIIAAVDKDDPRPLWYSDWGTDNGAAVNNLKRALDRVLRERGPEGYARFKSKLRLSSYDKFGDHTTTIAPPFAIWVDTFRPPVEGKRWYHRFSALTSQAGGFDLKRDVLTGHGPLGELYPTNTTHWGKEGDTMTFLYLVPTGMNDPNEPFWGSWAGRYGLNESFPGKRYYWASPTDTWNGATSRDNTLARWAVDLQNDFRARLDRCVKSPREANHAPHAVVNGSEGKEILHLTARPGQDMPFDAGASGDPDGDKLACEWFVYREAGTYQGEVSLTNVSSPHVLLHVPTGAAGKTIHVVLTVHDNGTPPLAAYRRVVVTVSSEPYFPPPESRGGWRTLGTPEDIRKVAGVDPARLDELREWLLQSDKRNFAAVVIRRGYVVLEVERGTSAKTDSRRVASVSKAVCATVLAIASEQSQHGLTPKKMTFDDPAFQFIPWAWPLSDPRKAQITVKQLLNHTSGLCPEATGAPNDGTWEYVLGLSGDPRTAKLAFDPGTGCGYSTHALCHAALVCETVTGKPYDQFAIEALFQPLGIEHWWFQYFNGGEAIGRHPTHGLGMPARDLARIAYCMLHEGRWGDRQVIPKWFVDQTGLPSHNVHTPELRWKLNPQTFTLGWELPALRGDGIPADARYKPGSGGQLMAFVPSLGLVITRQTGSSGEWAYEEYVRRACAAVLPGPETGAK